VETWNEFHEATDVAASKEYDRQYIDLTAKNILAWRALDNTNRPYAWIDLGRYPYTRGLQAPNVGDGTWKTIYLAGRQAAYPDPSSTPDPSYHIYLNVDDSYILGQNNSPTPVWVTVEYFDGGTDSWYLQYDSVGPNDIPHIFKATIPENLQNTNLWKRKTFYPVHTLPTASKTVWQTCGWWMLMMKKPITSDVFGYSRLTPLLCMRQI
jgi:hypothetical protein